MSRDKSEPRSLMRTVSRCSGLWRRRGRSAIGVPLSARFPQNRDLHSNLSTAQNAWAGPEKLKNSSVHNAFGRIGRGAIVAGLEGRQDRTRVEMV